MLICIVKQRVLKLSIKNSELLHSFLRSSLLTLNCFYVLSSLYYQKISPSRRSDENDRLETFTNSHRCSDGLISVDVSHALDRSWIASHGCINMIGR